MRTKLLLIAALAGGLVRLALCEGTVVDSSTLIGTPTVYTITWTASTNGIVSASTTYHVRGMIERVVCLASPTGATYSVTAADASGVDMFAGLGSGMSSNVATCFVPGVKITNGTVTNVVPMAVNDLLTISVTGAGSNKTGSVILYLR